MPTFWKDLQRSDRYHSRPLSMGKRIKRKRPRNRSEKAKMSWRSFPHRLPLISLKRPWRGTKHLMLPWNTYYICTLTDSWSCQQGTVFWSVFYHSVFLFLINTPYALQFDQERYNYQHDLFTHEDMKIWCNLHMTWWDPDLTAIYYVLQFSTRPCCIFVNDHRTESPAPTAKEINYMKNKQSFKHTRGCLCCTFSLPVKKTSTYVRSDFSTCRGHSMRLIYVRINSQLTRISTVFTTRQKVNQCIFSLGARFQPHTSPSHFWNVVQRQRPCRAINASEAAHMVPVAEYSRMCKAHTYQVH